MLVEAPPKPLEEGSACVALAPPKRLQPVLLVEAPKALLVFFEPEGLTELLALPNKPPDVLDCVVVFPPDRSLMVNDFKAFGKTVPPEPVLDLTGVDSGVSLESATSSFNKGDCRASDAGLLNLKDPCTPDDLDGVALKSTGESFEL